MAPPNVTVRYVEHPSDELIEEAVQIFSVLMLESPAAAALLGGNLALVPAMGRATIGALARISGEMYAATDENGKLVGFTLWTVPGRALFDTEDQLAEGWTDFENQVPPETKGYYTQSMSVEWPAFLDKSLGIEHASKNTYYCHCAFVRADYHNKGIAKALFALVFDKARKIGATVALGTTNEKNVIKYERIGLENKGSIAFSSPWRDWSSWAFVKDMKEGASQAAT